MTTQNDFFAKLLESQKEPTDPKNNPCPSCEWHNTPMCTYECKDRCLDAARENMPYRYPCPRAIGSTR